MTDRIEVALLGRSQIRSSNLLLMASSPPFSPLISSDLINRQLGSGFDVSLMEELREICREQGLVTVPRMRTKSEQRSSGHVINIRTYEYL